MDKQTFYQIYTPYALRVYKETGVNPNFVLGQWAYESGWGTSYAAQNFNLAGIKISGSHRNRQYNSSSEFTDDYIKVLNQENNQPWIDALKNAKDYASMINSMVYTNYNQHKTYDVNLAKNMLEAEYYTGISLKSQDNLANSQISSSPLGSLERGAGTVASGADMLITGLVVMLSVLVIFKAVNILK